MYAISKLSTDSQRFVNFLASGDRSRSLLTSIAIGKALAKTVSLPTAEVDNLEQFYKSVVLIDLQTKLSTLNELAVVDVNTALDYTYRFYAVRYYSAFPKRTVFCPRNETALADFMGLSLALDPKATETISAQPMELTNLHNGFVQFFEEIAA